MNWEITYRPEEKILSVKTGGVLEKESVLKMIVEASGFLTEHQCHRCLVDHTGIESTQIGITDIYGMPKVYDAVGLPRDLKLAMVVPQKYFDLFKFLETVDYNFGYTISVFMDTGPAVRWLKS